MGKWSNDLGLKLVDSFVSQNQELYLPVTLAQEVSKRERTRLVTVISVACTVE